MGPAKSLILHHPEFYPENIISIEYLPNNTYLNTMIPDIRNDERIINALKKENKYHVGLKVNIDTVETLSINKLRLKISITNNDSFSYYIIDPDKIEIGLLQYFTNGLVLRDNINKSTYYCNIPFIIPEPHDKWDMNWISLIISGEKQIFAIDFTYSQYIPEGLYLAEFQFPTFKAQIEPDEIIQENGRIWLGKLYAEEEIVIK